MKEMICTGAGLVGSFIAGLFGGWSAALTTLVWFMGIDYVSGLVCAGVFHKSQKSKNGALESHACWKGVIRKAMTLAAVLVAYRLDLLVGMSYLKDTACIAFIAGEAISIMENAGLMGVPMPNKLKDAIEMLQKKGDSHGNDDNEKG